MNREPSKVRRLLALVAQIHLDELDSASLGELDALLRESEAMRRLYLEAMQIAELAGSATQNLEEPLSLRINDQSADDRAVLAELFDEAIRNRQTEEIREQAQRALEADQTERLAERRRSQELTPAGPRVIVIPRAAIYGLIAAALLMATGLFAWWSNPRANTPSVEEIAETPAEPPARDTPVVLGTILSSHNDRWSSERANDAALTAGEYELLDGFVQFRLNDGAEVLLEGPARFRVDGTNSLAMEHGKLFANVPPGAIGFTVNTPTARVVDIGTEFGVSAGLNESGTHLQVYRGEVRAAPKLDGGVAGDFVSLFEKDAVAFINNGAPVKLAFDASLYARDLYDVRLRPELSEDARWLAQAPPDLRIGQSESRELRVILERRGVLLEEEVVVDFNRYQGWPAAGFGNNHVAAGQRIDAYLLHLDSPGNRRVDGDYTIRFGRPVLGVIGTSEGLNATDALLGHPGVTYVDLDDLESFSGGARGIDIENDDDVGWIEPDGSTLRLQIGTSGYTDQVRVLVEAAPEAEAHTPDERP